MDQPRSESRAGLNVQNRDTYQRFTLVRRKLTGEIGWVLRTDHFGVFVQWDDEVRYVREYDIDAVTGAVQTFVDELVAIIRWLHPDEQVDPRSMKMIRLDVGDHAAVLLNDIALSGRLVRNVRGDFDDDTD